MMGRGAVINSVLSLFERPTYLEVGVNAGHTFFEIQAAEKVAVDPKFMFDAATRGTDTQSFHEVTSDEFFGSVNGDRTYDVIYLDGLHTFDQTTRDLVNALCLLKPGGVIAIDDVLPNSFHASLPDQYLAAKLREKFLPGSQDYSWMGDVYRVVYFVRNFVPQYSYATVADNHGQLVMWREPRAISSPQPMVDIARAGFETVVQREAEFNILPMATIMERLKRRF